MASGVISFNTTVDSNTANTSAESPSTSTTPQLYTSCQFVTAYNTLANRTTSSPSTKPTYANTACNKHMFSDKHMLEGIHDIEPIKICVANKDRSTGVVASQMGTAKLKGFNKDGTPTSVILPNVLFTPALPANLVSVSSLYSSGFHTVDPHYGQQTLYQNLYYSNDHVTLPAYKENCNSGLWRFNHQNGTAP